MDDVLHRVFVSRLGDTDFLVIEGVESIPINKIVEFDLNGANGGSQNCVIIRCEGREPSYYNYDQADLIRKFLEESELT